MVSRDSRDAFGRARSRRGGFTMIELMVVICIIVVLIALLLPSVRYARVAANKVVAASNMRQVANAMIGLVDKNGKLPTGVRDNGAQHCIWISTATRTAILNYLGKNPAILNQPVLQDPQFDGNFDFYQAGVGYVIGYEYLAGHGDPSWDPSLAVTPHNEFLPSIDWGTGSYSKAAGAIGWKSAGRLRDVTAEPILADLTAWSPLSADGLWTYIAWTKGGGMVASGSGATPDVYQAAGGFVAYKDGSVLWKNIGPKVTLSNGTTQWGDMIEHETWGYTVAPATSVTGANGTYPALW